jgi:hypothetical protein
MRKVNKFRKHVSGSVPEIAIHVYFKKFEPPTNNEGFEEVT